MVVDLHRHDEFSFYDGSGNAKALAKIAKEKGYTSLGLSNHGNTHGLVRHYNACKEAGIKPIMGVEGYFLPKYKEQKRGYHLCLFAKNLKGYKNINVIQTLGEEQKYFNPIWDFDLLEKYSEGLICTSACVAGYLAQCIYNDKIEQAKKFIKKMVSIFGDDFYIEIQPYSVSEKGMQEKVNIGAIKLAKEFGVKCILTSDSHRGRKEEIEQYIKMHELKGKTQEQLEEIRRTYEERYMPELKEMYKRFVKMHKYDFHKNKAESHQICLRLGREMYANLEEIEAKVDDNIIDTLASIQSLPKFDKNKDSFELIKKETINGLKARGKWKKEYIERAKEELKVIKQNKFEDYFLIVQDYVRFAKRSGIAVGPGRGSGCNCLVNYALGITDVDPVLFDLDYTRFIRFGKDKLPDIDLDFETERRAEVIKYIVDKYAPNAVQIASYGMYKVDNLINDLVKTYDNLADDKKEIAQIKKCINSHKDSEGVIDLESVAHDTYLNHINKQYEGLLDSFIFLYNKAKYMGTHAAGVAISNIDLNYYTCTRINSKNGKKFSSYDLVDLERCGIIKYDILGLGTLSSIYELRNKTHTDVDYESWVNDKEIIKAFSEGRSLGVFQYDKPGAQGLLAELNIDNFNDVIAASAINRPGPLSLGVHKQYAEAKVSWKELDEKPFYADYVDDTNGCILYQEQVRRIAHDLGGLNWDQADKIQKMDDPNSPKCKILIDKYYDEFIDIFTKTTKKKYGIPYEESKQLFDNFLNYTFNKGHSTGYALISLEEMFYKVHYPTEFWFSKLKYAPNETDYMRYMKQSIADGNVVFLPHVNYSLSKPSIRKVDGEMVIQQGLSDLKNVGLKAALEIEEERKKNGIFRSYDDFYDRCKSRVVTTRVIEVLRKNGALEFNKKSYISRVIKFNSSYYGR